ncbi:hypothetical protein P7C70_g3889, partial [Phenoliferia sp. Uapishka_3]
MGNMLTRLRRSVIVRGAVVGPPSVERLPISDDQLQALEITQLKSELAQLRKRVSQQDKIITKLRPKTSLSSSAGGSTDGNSDAGGPRIKLEDFDQMSPTSVSQNFVGGRPGLAALAMSSQSTQIGRGEVEDKSDILRPYLRVLGLPVDQTRSPINRVSVLLFSPIEVVAQDLNLQPSPSLESSLGPPAFKSRRSDSSLAFQSLLDLVPVAHSNLIVEASLNAVDWIHCVVHVPSWLREHNEWIERMKRGIGEVKEEWLAVYFAIISVRVTTLVTGVNPKFPLPLQSGLYFLDQQLGASLGLSPGEIVSLPHLWFEASLEALHRSDFMASPTFEAVQVICILPMISHNFGASAYIESLLHMGLKIAQSLHLHLLGPETKDSPTDGLIKRELGRRAWMCLYIAESHRDTTMPGSLYLPPALTVEPTNINDENLSDAHPMIPRPLKDSSLVTHLLAMGQHATIFRQFNTAFHAAPTLQDQYDVVLASDAKLLNLLSSFPSLLPTLEPYPAEHNFRQRFDYLPMARFMWAMLLGPSRIMMYRSFLGRSYSDERFGDARKICIEAARGVLEERRRPIPQLYERPWHITAYTVLAGVILGTELIHGPDLSLSDRSTLHSEICEIIAILPRGGPSNKVITRGIELLERVLKDSQINSPPPIEKLWPGFGAPGVGAGVAVAHAGGQDWGWGNQYGGAVWDGQAAGGDFWSNTVRSFEAIEDPFWVATRWWAQ